MPPPLFPYCRVLVNHRYRTLYLKAPKTGSTSLLTLLGTCTGDKQTDKPTCFEPLQVGEVLCWVAGAAGLYLLPAMPSSRCSVPVMPLLLFMLSRLHALLLQPMKSQDKYSQMFADYFVWTVVRNPWARAVSSYRMLSRYIRSECKVGAVFQGH